MKMVNVYERQERMDFAKRAAIAFSNNDQLHSYTDKDISTGSLFALRFGLDRDCVVVFRIGEDVENYQNIIE